MVGPVTVQLVEDNRLVAEALAALLNRRPELSVVGTAADAESALRQVQEMSPQVVLLDSALGDHDSFRLAESLRGTAPSSKVVVMALLPVEQDLVEFVRTGVVGFIVKEASGR